MGKYEEHIDHIVDQTVEGLDKVLSPDALDTLRGVLALTFETHPALNEIINESAPVEDIDNSDFRPVDLAQLMAPPTTDKKHGGHRG